MAGHAHGEPRNRDTAGVRVPPPLVPLVAIVLGVVLQRRWPLFPELAVAGSARAWIGSAVVAGALLGLGFWSVALLRRSGQSENPYKPTSSIVDRGPFRITRNPMYLQMVLVCIGFSIIYANPWILLMTPAVGLLLQLLAIEPEEAYLEAKFGEEYLAYKRRVRRWL